MHDGKGWAIIAENSSRFSREYLQEVEICLKEMGDASYELYSGRIWNMCFITVTNK